MGGTRVFFRDDDVGSYSSALSNVVELLLQSGIPCHYEVVPEYLDPESAGELRRLQEAHPGLVHLDQHGLRHSQEIQGRQLASEFAGGRPFEDQLSDIGKGREMLEQALGESFSGSVFTPPCHKYDSGTVRALGDLGFDTLSAGVRVDWPSRIYYGVGRALGRVSLLGKRVSYHGRRLPDGRLCEVSVAIDVHEDVDAAGRRLVKTAQQLWNEFCVARRRLDAVGVMLHHQACESADELRALREFVARLVGDPTVSFVEMRALRQGP